MTVVLTCDECGTEINKYPSQVKEHNFCGLTCLGAYRSKHWIGPRAANWKGGISTDRDRVLWHLPWHPDADHKGYVSRCRVVAEMKIGRPLLPGEVVHHKDEDDTNDHPDNIEVLPSQAEHARIHGLNRTPEQMAAMRAARRSAA